MNGPPNWEGMFWRFYAAEDSDIFISRDTDSRVDSDHNGIDDYLDVRRTEMDENYKNEQIRIADLKIQETERANKAREEIQKEALKKSNQPK